MTDDVIKSRVWRDRADEYRLFSEESESVDARRAYAEVSRSCAMIADRLEKLEAIDRLRLQRPRGLA